MAAKDKGSESDQGHEDLHVRKISACNPNTPETVLVRLSQDHTNNIRHRVAENPRTPAEILSKLAADSHSEVRLAVAENPNTPPELLAQLSGDACVDVRYGVAENPHMPEDILFKLSEDENPYVRCRALKTLQMMTPEVQARLRLMMQNHYHEKHRHAL
jgi:hypothetical protein